VLPTAKPSQAPTAVPTLTPAPSIASLTAALDAESPKTTVVVDVALESDAIVYCGAFEAAVTLTSANDVVVQRFSATSVSGAARVTVTGLSAATAYNIYCAAQSFQGALLTLEGMLAHTASVTTDCCMTVKLEMTSDSVPANGAALDALRITLDSLPTSDLNVTLSATSKTLAASAPAFYPSVITFRKGSTKRTATVTIAAADADGLYQVAASVNGADAAKYAPVFSTPRAITVLSAFTSPPAPTVSGAAFNGDGSAVLLSFSGATNRAGYTGAFPCAAVLDFVGMATARCQWTDAASIAIYPSRGAAGSLMLLVGSPVTLLGAANVTAACIAAKTSVCARYDRVLTTMVTLTVPAVKTRPTAALGLPSSVSGCSTMTVDISASTGSGGRDWLTPTFSVTNAGADVTELQRFLNRNFTQSAPTVVPSALFLESGTYTFSMTLCNFLGACDTASKSVPVDKDADAAVVVTIPGQPLREITTSTALLLTASTYLVNCQRTRSYADVTLSWSVYDAGVLQPLLRSESLDTSTFRLSAYRLVPLHYYEIRLTATHAATGASSFASVTVKVGQAEVVALVQGGSAQTVAIGSSITMDGSSSIDRDVQGATGAAAGLLFSWSCVQLAPSYAQSCPLDVSRDGSVAVLPRTESLVLFALTKAVNTTSLVTLTVTDASKARSSSTSVTIKSQDSSAPVVAVTTSSDALTDVNTRKTLQLSGTVTVQSACTAQWSSSAFPNGLRALSLTAPSALVPSGTTQTLTLLLAASALPERSAFTFTLGCGVSAASIEVTTNGPPLPGTFVVTPADGTEMSTVFQFLATVWTDSNLPISYQFGFTSASTGAAMVLQGRGQGSVASSTLPAGKLISQYALECVVQVFDALNAMSTASATVRVEPQVNVTALQSTMRSQLTASLGNNEATKGLLSVSGAVLNTVSCVLAPACASLNRGACSAVQNTCGECLSGYVGEPGDRNSQCIDTAAAKVLNTGAGSIGDTCTTHADCAGWNLCNTTLAAPECYLPGKECPNECSRQGDCFFQRLSDGSTVRDCKTGDPSCAAVCACDAAYSGQDCSVPASVAQERQALRSEFLTTLLSVAKTDDASEENIASLSTSLASLAQNPFELPLGAHTVVNDVAAIVLSSMADVTTVSYEAATSVLDAVNAAAQASTQSRSADASVGSAVVDTVSLFADIVAAQLLAGQNGVSYIQDTFRMSATRQSANALRDQVITAAVTDLEAAASSTVSSVAVDGLDDSSEEVAVTLISTAASAYGAMGSTFNTNPLRVKVARSSGTETVVRFTLYHHAAVEFTNATEAATQGFNSTCAGDGDRSVYYHTCLDSGAELMNNCTGLGAGVLTSHCPVLRPSCGVLNSTAGALDTTSPACEVTGYDAYSTNCTCILTASDASAGGRRLSSDLAKSGLLDVVSSSVYLASEFVDTFSSADDLTSLAALKRVLIVIVMFGTLWAGGLLLIFTCVWRRKLMAPFNADKEKKVTDKADKVQASTRSALEVRRYLTDYVVATFPSVFSNKPFFSRVYLEIARHHKYLMVITAQDGDAGDKQRILTGAQLLSVQTMLMFSLALLYDVQGPADDGSCVRLADPDSCLIRKSPFDSSISFCQWNEDTSLCSYQEPMFSLQVVIYIAVIVSLLTATINYPIDLIFELLSAPVADDVKLANQEAAISRIGRRVSNMARRASNVASNLATAARDRLSVTRRSIVGTVTRKIPPATETAHALANASVMAVADDFRKSLQLRQMSRMREFHDFTDPSVSAAATSVDPAADSGSSSDSDASSDEETGAVEVRQVANTAARAPVRSSAVVARNQAVGDVDAIMHRLAAEIAYQRQKLKPSELIEFDEQWGLDPATGEFLRSEASLVAWLRGQHGVAALIQREVKYVRSESVKRVEKLNIATDKHIGLEILHMFIKDLLGRNTPAAIIFETKAKEDFEHTKVVSRSTKYLAVLALVAINAFFVYYALLTGFRRGISWQRMYLVACLLQFAVEILLFETMEVAWVNCVIPALVSNEVRSVGDSIIEVVQRLCAGTLTETTRFLNAPDYLFVATSVAKKFPHLMESVVVQAYSSHLPGELAKTWHGGAATRATDHRNVRQFALLASTLALLQYIATAPFIVHRMFIRFVQPLVLTALAIVWAAVVSDPIYLAIACVISACLVAYVLYRYYLDKVEASARVQMMAPVVAEYADGVDNRESSVRDSDGGALNHYPGTVLHSQKARDLRAPSSSGGDSGDASSSSATHHIHLVEPAGDVMKTRAERRANPIYDTSSSSSSGDKEGDSSDAGSGVVVRVPKKAASKVDSYSVSSLHLDSVAGRSALSGGARQASYVASRSDSDDYSISSPSVSSGDHDE
jgi:hypothetical protein